MKKGSSKLEKTIQYSFRNKRLLEQALTHSSHAYEGPTEYKRDNEVLEFLGDSVLGLVIADFICEKYSGLSEGNLSKLKSTAASTTALSGFAANIKLGDSLLLGKGEEKSGGRKKKTILAGTYEALTAAVYLDGGLEEARRFLLSQLKPFYKKINMKKFLVDNYKSALQEYFQKDNLPPPRYRTVTTKGPDHRKVFTIEVVADRKILASATGSSKKDAEQKAAQTALKRLMGRKIRAFTTDTFLLRKKP